jgi:hypothetical protein
MYNLLVTAETGAWDRTDYVVPASRYLEYTNDGLAARLKPLDDGVRKELVSLPTLFAYESPVGDDARIGWIQAIHRRESEIRITFQLDGELAPIPAERLEALAWELEIGSWEMNRTHWAVKDVDLLAVLTSVTRVPRTHPPYVVKAAIDGADVDAIAELADERDLELVARAVRDAIESNEPVYGLDRLHTFTTKLLRSLCERNGLTTEREKPLHSLFGSYIKTLRDAGHIESEMTDRILRTSISVMESFNDVRNNQSLAHDNVLLNHNEASLIFNHVINTLRFVKELEGNLRRREQEAKPERPSRDS